MPTLHYLYILKEINYENSFCIFCLSFAKLNYKKIHRMENFNKTLIKKTLLSKTKIISAFSGFYFINFLKITNKK